MDALALVLCVASVLIVMAGVGKGLDPRPTASALAALGPAIPIEGVRAFGAFEVVLGVAACYALLTRDRAAAPTAGGTASAIADVDLHSGRTALVFLSTTCLTCREIWQALGAAASPLPDGVRPVIVTKSDEPATKV